MKYLFLMIEFALLGLAGLLWVTLPDGPIPDISWRMHYGAVSWLFGAMAGLGFGVYLSRRKPDLMPVYGSKPVE